MSKQESEMEETRSNPLKDRVTSDAYSIPFLYSILGSQYWSSIVDLSLGAKFNLNRLPKSLICQTSLFWNN